MGFDWVGRLAIGLAILGALAMLFSCDLMLFDRPGWCSAPPDPVEIGGFLSPAQIVPAWYLLPLYGVLRSISFNVGPIDAKALGMLLAVAVFAAPLILAFFNWSKTPARAWLSLLVTPPVLVGLGWIGAQHPSEQLSNAGLALAALYLTMFWIAFPLLARARPHERSSISR